MSGATTGSLGLGPVPVPVPVRDRPLSADAWPYPLPRRCARGQPHAQPARASGAALVLARGWYYRYGWCSAQDKE